MKGGLEWRTRTRGLVRLKPRKIGSDDDAGLAQRAQAIHTAGLHTHPSPRHAEPSLQHSQRASGHERDAIDLVCFLHYNTSLSFRSQLSVKLSRLRSRTVARNLKVGTCHETPAARARPLGPAGAAGAGTAVDYRRRGSSHSPLSRILYVWQRKQRCSHERVPHWYVLFIFSERSELGELHDARAFIHYSALCSASSVSVSVSPLSYLSTLLTSPAHLQPSSMYPSLHWKRE